MNARHVILAAGLAIAAWLAIFGDKTPTAEVAEAVARTEPSLRPPASPLLPSHSEPARKAEREPIILALQPRETLIGGASVDKQTQGLFGSQSWTPPPPPPPKPPPPPPPTAPRLPFTYLGKKVEDGAWEVYLARGDQTFIVRANSVIEDTYRVESIKPPTLSLTYLPLDQMQTLTIGGAD
jgi:hypothetical protein